MKKIKLLAAFFLSAILFNISLAQVLTIKGVKPLNVGDKIPDVYLSNIINYKKKDARLLSEFGGRPILLDIWNLGCESCITGMPMLDSIQKESGDKISIILVNGWARDSAPLVETFFRNNRIGRKVSLPTTNGDSVLRSYFPGEPHKVWIDKNGVIKSISEADQGTRENIRRFIEGKPIRLKQLEREVDAQLVDLPLMVIDQQFNKGKGMLSYSYLSGYDSISRKRSMGSPELKDGYMTLSIKNKDIRQLYKIAYYSRDWEGPFKPMQFIVESRHVPDYDQDGNNVYSAAKDLYCYEALLKDTSRMKIYRKMQEDLDRFFNLKSSFEIRKMPCLVLRRIKPGESKLGVRNDHYRGIVITADSIEFSKSYWKGIDNILNHSMDWVPKKTMPSYLPYPVIDETGYAGTGPFDLTIPAFPRWNDLEKVNEVLASYNLKVALEARDTEVIVLRD